MPEKEEELIVELPLVEDGLVTIRCQWEDLLEHFNLQMWLRSRVTAEQRMHHTREYFSKFILGNDSTPYSQMATNVVKFKCPQNRNEEEAQSAARAANTLHRTQL